SPRPSLRTRRRTAGAGAFAAATLLLMPACRPEPPVTASDADDSIPLDYLPALHGDYFELQSEKVGRPFHIYVRFPERYESEDARYPVVYLLDGDSLFPILASNHLFLSYDEGLPKPSSSGSRTAPSIRPSTSAASTSPQPRRTEGPTRAERRPSSHSRADRVIVRSSGKRRSSGTTRGKTKTRSLGRSTSS